MKRIGLIALMALVAPLAAHAEGEDSLAWKADVDLSVNLTQNTYSDNWTGGEAGNVTWVAGGNSTVEKTFTAPWSWRNTAKLAYGQTHNQDAESNQWKRPVKSTDKIDIESLLRFLKWGELEPYLAFRLISQFEDADDPNRKLHFNPIDLTESFGAAKTILKKEDDEILTRLGFGLRQRLMRVFADDTSTKTTTKSSNDGGIEWVTDAKYKIPKSSIVWKSKLTAFKALFYSESDALKGTAEEDYWKAIDANWENTFSAQVAKYIAVSLYVQWLYDKEIDRAGRFKQTLAMGLTWKML